MTESVIRVPVSEIELVVQVRGDGAPPVLFIHGFPFDHALWRHQLAALSRWHCVAPDLRGAGASGVSESPDDYSVARYAADLVQVLDHLDIEEAVMCGLSLGGYIVFELLRRFPERVRAAMLCNTKAAADTAQAKRDRDVMATVAEQGGAAAIATQLLPKLLARATRERQPQIVREVTAMIERAPVRGIVGALHALRERPDSTPLLPRIRIPVLVVAGDDDQIAPAAGMQEMACAIAGAQFALIPGAGHVAPLEQPLAVSAALADFLAKLR
jgi:pimeloyl-ACP methyl ester carboxylesterase